MSFFKKVFSKKVIITAIVIIIETAGLKIGYSLMFKVEGTVLKVDSNNITIANFFSTQTVNLIKELNKIILNEKNRINRCCK